MRRFARVLSVLMALSLALVPSASQAIYRWTFMSGVGFALDEEQVCRDGARVTATGFGTEFEPSISLEAYVYNNAVDPPYYGDTWSYETYGPLLSATRTFTPTYHEEPIRADSLRHYYTHDALPWLYPLKPGTRILVGSITDGAALDSEVKDCYLNPPELPTVEVAHGSSAPLDDTNFMISYDMLPPANTFFQLDTLPAHGELRQNGVLLGVGDVFTQEDVAAGQLTYTHDDSSTTADSFAYHVRSVMRVSVDTFGIQADGPSFAPALSGNGLQVVFASDATNLVQLDDFNGVRDIFVHDLREKETRRVSMAANGDQADGPSDNPKISHYSGPLGFPYTGIVYESQASNLVSEGDCVGSGANGMVNVFWHWGGFVECVQGNFPSIGVYNSIAFASDATDLLINSDDFGREDDNEKTDIYLKRHWSNFSIISVATGQDSSYPWELADGPSSAPAISTFGNHVAFQSYATNLVDNDTNEAADIFVRDGTKTVRVSVSSDGTQANDHAHAPAISGDGRFVAFDSAASNLVDGDINGHFDVFVHDRDANGTGIFDELDTPGGVRTTRVSIASDGADGNGDSRAAAISYNGRFIAFHSYADNLVPDDTNGFPDIFVHDRDANGNGIFDEPGGVRTTRISVAADGTEADGPSYGTPSISGDGSFVAFASDATNLVADDTNQSQDIFVHYMSASAAVPLQIQPEAPTKHVLHLPMTMHR